MPLSLMNIGETGVIKRIIGKDDVQKHIQNIGFVIGSSITIVSKNGENLIVNIKGTRVAIDKQMAQRIML